MNWISLKLKSPKDYVDVLVTDGERCWVATYFKTISGSPVWLASHPDYRRKPENEYGVPFLTHSSPTHWIDLPEMSEEG